MYVSGLRLIFLQIPSLNADLHENRPQITMTILGSTQISLQWTPNNTNTLLRSTNDTYMPSSPSKCTNARTDLRYNAPFCTLVNMSEFLDFSSWLI